MTDPSHDLSGLQIDRDQPSPGSKRALKASATLAAAAAVFAGGVLWLSRGAQGIVVGVAPVEVVGGGGASGTGITANGYVVARTKASVSSRLSGRLAYLGVEEGSVVRRGQVIARLDNRDFHAAVAQTEAELLRAEAALREAAAQRDQLERDLARARDLLAKNLDSEQNVEDITARLAAGEARVGVRKAQVQAAEAAIEVARANLDNTYIRAPFDGTVLRKDAEVGEVVAPVATGGGLTRGAVVTMADLQTLEVEVDVNEAYIAQVENGQAATIVLDAYPDETFSGAVRQIVPTADRQRATVLVKVSILEADPRILPEMGARVQFLFEEEGGGGGGGNDVARARRLFVPAEACRTVGDDTVVWVVRDGVAYRSVVDAGPVSAGRREIRSGLSGGEQVVLDAPADLEDGARVRVNP